MGIRNNKNLMEDNQVHEDLWDADPESFHVDQDQDYKNLGSLITKKVVGVDSKGSYVEYHYSTGSPPCRVYAETATKGADKGDPQNSVVSDRIRSRIEMAGVEYHASDNISDFIEEGELKELEDELAEKFNEVIKTLIIDPNDPNSRDTGRRMAKMYIHEQLFGRYYPKPKVTAFPNEGARSHNGMLVVPADIKSMCSHHHKDVKGICYIGIIPGDKVIGLSKYARIAWHCARRGTLQEELTNDIAREIAEASGTEDVIVWIKAEHGCMSCRGILTDNSATVTMVTKGAFNHNQELKRDFLTHINMIAGSGFKCS